jgi:hypothetical protein
LENCKGKIGTQFVFLVGKTLNTGILLHRILGPVPPHISGNNFKFFVSINTILLKFRLHVWYISLLAIYHFSFLLVFKVMYEKALPNEY